MQAQSTLKMWEGALVDGWLGVPSAVAGEGYHFWQHLPRKCQQQKERRYPPEAAIGAPELPELEIRALTLENKSKATSGAFPW